MKLFSNVPTYVITIPHRHGQTDGRTTCHGNTALCIASRGKNYFAIKLFSDEFNLAGGLDAGEHGLYYVYRHSVNQLLINIAAVFIDSTSLITSAKRLQFALSIYSRPILGRVVQSFQPNVFKGQLDE